MKLPSFAIAVAVVAYLLTPGPSPSLLGSWPLTPMGVVALVAALGLAMLTRPSARSGVRSGWTLLLFALIVMRAVLSVTETPSGWLARYYANDEWRGRPEWSSDFRLENATRIDPALSFAGTEFPTHYLNGARFTEGVFREVTEPMSVEWSGAFDAPADGDVLFDIRANGRAALVFDDAAPVFEGQTGSGRHRVTGGRHTVTARYAKGENAEGAFHLSLRSRDGAAITVVPPAFRGSPSALHRSLAAVLDAMVIVLLAAAAILSLRQAWSGTARVPALVGTGLVVVFGLQGLIAARKWIVHFQSLSGGDDWLGFESRARDVLENGVLMTLGRPLGEGAAYFYHPFYSYVLAAVHAVAGESLFGPIFMHFMVLAATAFLMWSFARDLFGERAAAFGLAALVVIFELDFIRYYTITLLSENLYILTVTLCLRAFARWARSESRGALVQAGLWAGLSAATRPAMMMFLVPAMVVAFLIARRQSFARGLSSAAIIAAAWLAVVLPFTIRNWVVARKLVLISDSLGGGFIVHNVPTQIDPAIYMRGYGGGVVASAGVLWGILVDHPAEMLSLQVQKLGFTLGMVHWFGDYRPHPELVAISVLYLVMIAASPAMRDTAMWPVHAFVLAHVASMGLTSPWNYGYRLILPPYVYTTTFAVAAAAAWLPPITRRRAACGGELR